MTTSKKLKNLVALFMTSVLCLALPAMAWGQKTSVSGTVFEKNGEPAIGATVMEKGTSNGTVTDIDGKFTINALPNATLVIS